MTPGTVDLRIQRWAPYRDFIEVRGVDLTGATLAMQLRLYRDAPGDPLVSLATTASPAEGLSVEVATVDGMPVSTIWIRINETTIEGVLPFTVTAGSPNRKAGSDVTLAHDIVLSGTGIPKARWFQGTATIEAGVTV